MQMYLQRVGNLKVTDEKSRIRICTKISRIRGNTGTVLTNSYRYEKKLYRNPKLSAVSNPKQCYNLQDRYTKGLLYSGYGAS
jgi:hypothetical protein